MCKYGVDMYLYKSDYQKKIDASTKKTEEARCGVPDDAELDLLQRELQEELETEHLLGEELRYVSSLFSKFHLHAVSRHGIS